MIPEGLPCLLTWFIAWDAILQQARVQEAEGNGFMAARINWLIRGSYNNI